MLPNITFDPILYKTAIPIPINNTNGTMYESSDICKTIIHNTTAINTYKVISESNNSFISVAVADIPLILHCVLAIFLISVIAFIVSSSPIPLVNVTSISVVPSLLNASCIFSGNISIGMVVPITSAAPTTLSTQSICLILSSIFIMSFVGIVLSTSNTENAPKLKSSDIIFWPFIVSILSGK